MKRILWTLLFASGFATTALAQSNAYLYKTTRVQAAPGKLLELIDLYKQRTAALKDVDKGSAVDAA